VVLDTNILTVPAQFSIDIFAEAETVLERTVEFVVLTSVVKELQKKLDAASTTGRFKFRVALDLVERCSLVDIDKDLSSKSVDDQILDFAEACNGVIATNDKELRSRALQRSIPVLLMRGKKRLVLQGTVR
jgi:rRNA-processing protein FCF1